MKIQKNCKWLTLLYSSHSTDSQITSAASGSICKTIMFRNRNLDLITDSWLYQLDSIILERYEMYLQWREVKLSILIITRDCRKSVITELPTNQEVWALRCSDSPWLDRVFKEEQELHQQDKLGKPTESPSSFAWISKEPFSLGPTEWDKSQQPSWLARKGLLRQYQGSWFSS